LAEIAYEKAGIIKEAIPVVIGETNPETISVFKEVAKKKSSTIIWAEAFTTPSNFHFPLLGKYQQTNFRTVLCVLKQLTANGFNITDHEIQLGLNNLRGNTGFYGRMQLIRENPTLILDVSHNVDGIQKTLESLQSTLKGKLHIIYGTSSDKNYEKIIDLFPKDARLTFCTFSNQRSISQAQIEELIKKKTLDAKIFSSVNSAISDAQNTANKEDTILVFGSFFLISDFF
jgi:dihydrofolate synthase/folylpolyglutamate synthase